MTPTVIEHRRADPPVLYAVACGSPPSGHIGRMVALAQRAGWRVCVLATPDGRRFIDATALASQTGHPVRSEFKMPGEADVLPPPDAIVVAPATVNTVNKWACGIADTLVLGILVEGFGLGLPIVAVPYTNVAMAAHPAFRNNLQRLRSWGVRVLFGDDVMRLPAPGEGFEQAAAFPWQLAMAAVGAPGRATMPPRVPASGDAAGAAGRRPSVGRSRRAPHGIPLRPAPPSAPRPAPAILRRW